jgi:F0F1-type ATP synthase assembly protein I
VSDQEEKPGRNARFSDANSPAGSPSSDEKLSAASQEQSIIVLLGRLAGFGWFVALSIAGGTLLGVWLDGKVDTSPILTLVGLGFGLSVAILGVVRLLAAFSGNRSSSSVDDPDNRHSE